MNYIADLRKVIGNRPIITVGATVVVINDQQEILFQHRSDTFDWGLPGGSMELGETLEQVASRELKEETGLDATRFELIDLLSGPEYYFRYPNGDETYNVIALYHAKNVSGILQMADGESLRLEYFGKQNLPPLIEKRAQKILDVLSDELWQLESSFTAK